jgi:hypothetical protein
MDSGWMGGMHYLVKKYPIGSEKALQEDMKPAAFGAKVQKREKYLYYAGVKTLGWRNVVGTPIFNTIISRLYIGS